MRHLLLLWCLASPLLTIGQSFENIRATQEGTKMIVLYDLVSERADLAFTVALYSSHNNFSTPVKAVVGSIGKGQKPGKDKRVEWDLRADLQTFSGQITVELAGIPEVVKLALKSPFLTSKPKQGKSTNIEWAGGTLYPNVKLELYRNGKLATALGDSKNDGSYTWNIPKDIEKGDGYTVRLSAGEEHVESPAFAISGASSSSRTKAILIPVGAAALVGIIFLIIPDKVAEAPDPKNP